MDITKEGRQHQEESGVSASRSKNNKLLTQGALLIALTIILQSLRLFIPLPLPVSTFIIGTLVHMMLMLTVQINCLATAILLSCALPIFAYAQGQLLLPVLIPVVILGNICFVMFVQKYYRGWLLTLPPLAKAVAMGAASYGVLTLLDLQQAPLAKTILVAMTIPQFITGMIGIVCAERIKTKLQIK